MEQIPEKLDWVQARHDCSLANEFSQLLVDAKDDVKRRSDLPNNPNIAYKVSDDEERRFVVKAESKVPDFISTRTAIFELEQDCIAVTCRNGAQKTQEFKITVGLNDRGKCMLTVGNEKLYRWQVLMRALDVVFFPKSV